MERVANDFEEEDLFLSDDKKDDISGVMEEFNLLDEFWFNLSNEEFNTK